MKPFHILSTFIAVFSISTGGMAWAHSTSVGFLISPSAQTTCVGGTQTPCYDVEIFYGTYPHGVISVAEGDLALFRQDTGGGETQVVGQTAGGPAIPFTMNHSRIATIPNTVSGTTYNYSTPGTADWTNFTSVFAPGTNYFWIATDSLSASSLSGTPTNFSGGTQFHQSATAVGLAPGTYRIAFDAATSGGLSANWRPVPAVETATFTLTPGGGIVVNTGGPPNVSLSGPSGPVAGPFTVTASFSEAVTGVDLSDFAVANGTVSNLVQIAPNVYTFTVTPMAAALTGGIAIQMPAGGATDIDSNTNTASSTLNVTVSSLGGAVSETAIDQVIQQEELKTLREGLLRSQRMARGARDRLARDIKCRTPEDEELTEAERLECDTLWKEAVIPLDADGTIVVSESTAMMEGSFFGKIEKNAGRERRLIFGEFSVTDDEDFGLIATLDGRVAWERMISDRTLFGYFIGAEVSTSDVEGAFTGDRERIGLSAGIYGARDLDHGLLADGFLTFGAGRNTLDITDGLVVVDGDYTALSVLLGGAVSGERNYESFDLRPELALSYGYTDIGDVDYAAIASGVSTSASFSGSDVALALLSFTPEMLFPMDYAEGSYDDGTFRVAPSLICEWVEAGASETNCGAALELELSARSDNGLREVSGRLRTETVGGTTRNTAAVALEHRF